MSKCIKCLLYVLIEPKFRKSLGMYASRYFQTLGLKYFIRPQTHIEPNEWVFESSPEDLKHIKVGFVSLKYGESSLFSATQLELFKKMRQAMQLEVESTLVVEGPQSKKDLIKLFNENPLPIWLILGDSSQVSFLKHQIILFENQKVLQTYHPADLNQNSELKKISWQDLKLVMTEVKG